MLIANLNRIPVENLSSMITTDFFFNILGSKTPVSEVSDLLFFSLFIFSFRIPLEWIINKLIKFRSRIFDKRSLNMGRLTILYSFVGENRIIFYISLKKKTYLFNTNLTAYKLYTFRNFPVVIRNWKSLMLLIKRHFSQSVKISK